ncbi:MAG: SdpI family protein [Terracidiphilus sp.]
MTRKVFFFEILLIAAALVATALLYPHFPARVPYHWNYHMEPDHFGPAWVLYLIGPGFMAGVMLMTWLFPWLSPKRFEIDGFWSTYHRVMLLFFGIMAYLYAVMLWSDCGRSIDLGRAMLSGVCVFIALFGNVMGKLRRNFYLGVRTPWTLASERVWNATHRFAAKTFVAGGLVGLIFSILGLFLSAILATLVGALAPVVYSLVIYKQLERRGEIDDGLPREQGERG